MKKLFVMGLMTVSFLVQAVEHSGVQKAAGASNVVTAKSAGTVHPIVKAEKPLNKLTRQELKDRLVLRAQELQKSKIAKEHRMHIAEIERIIAELRKRWKHEDAVRKAKHATQAHGPVQATHAGSQNK